MTDRIAELEALVAKQEALLERQQELLDAALKANADTFRYYAEYNQRERENIERRACIKANAAMRKRMRKLVPSKTTQPEGG